MIRRRTRDLGDEAVVAPDAVGVEHEHTLAELVERGEEPVALSYRDVSLLQCPGQRLLEFSGVLVASLWAHDVSRTAR